MKSELSKKTNKNIYFAQKALVWINNQKDVRGSYHNMLICYDTKSCYFSYAGTSLHENLPVLWARYKYYKKTNDTESFRLLLFDLENFNKEDRIIANDFWNCRMMFELWQDNIFNEIEKKQIENICFNSNYYPIDLSNSEIKEIDIKKIINGNIKFSDFLNETEKYLLNYYTSYPSDFIFRYIWKRENNDLQLAKYYFNKAIQLYFERKNDFTDKDFCLLGISSLDFFELSKNKDYIIFSEKILNENIKPIVFENKIKSPVCVIFIDELYKLSKNKIYKNMRDNIIDYFINNSFDEENYNGYFLGDGSFNEIKDKNVITSSKSVRNNALMVVALVESE